MSFESMTPPSKSKASSFGFEVSVVVVSYNVAGLLEKCLESVYNTSRNISLEVIVVDNASADGSATLVADKFPHATLIKNSENYGFPAACNQGWRRASGRFIFFLNPDAILEPDALEKLLDFMNRNTQAGICGPLLRYGDGSLQSSRRRFLTPAGALVESTILQRYAPFKNLPLLRRFYFDDVPLDIGKPQQVDWLVGAAMLMRWEVLVQTGGFDERFFMYSEEMDLCKTATAGGWQVWFVPEAQVTHLEGRSSIQNVAARHINFNTSRVSYIRKHHGRFTGWWLRQFLLMTYRFQYIEEGFKFLVRHKPELRRERLQMIRRVRASRLLPGKYPRPPLTRGVCLLSAEFPTQPGGVGDYTECLAREFAKSFETLVITGTHNSGPEKPEYPLAHPVEVWNWRSLRRIADYLAEHPCSVLNIQYQTGAYQMHPAVNFLPFYLRQRTGNARPKVVTTFHDLRPPYLFPKAGPARKWVTRFLMKCSDAAVVTNYEDYRTALGWGVSGQKLWLVPIGSNISPLTPPVPEERAVIRAHWKIKPDDFLIGYFGLLNHSKGVDVLLDAFSLLKTEPGWKLLIIGGSTGETDKTNQPYALQLTAQIERLELFERVIWTGYLPPDQTSQALYALDAAALPFRDGLSLRRGSLLAALSHGVPVLTTEPDASHKPEPGSVPGYSRLPEMQLLLDRSVLTVKVGDATGLAEALRKLRGEPDLRRRLSEASLEFSSHIRWSEIARSLLEVYTAC